MSKVSTPRGEKVLVRRRWYPWPNVFREETLESAGIASPAARALEKNGLGDKIVASLIVTFLLLLPLLAGATVIFTIFFFLIGGGLVAKYLALPWILEVVHEGVVVESEECEGYSRTSRRIEQVSELYETGTLLLPTKKIQVRPERESALPVAQPKLPDLAPPTSVPEDEEKPFALPEESPFEAPAPQTPPSPPPAEPAYGVLETPLRRALRRLEEEEQELASKGVTLPRAGREEEKRARPKK